MSHANTEATLRQIALFLANLAGKSKDVYWLSSPGFQSLAYISPAFDDIWGRSRDDVYANAAIWVEAMHPEDYAKYHPIMADHVTHVDPDAHYDESYRIIRPNGDIRWIIDRGFPVYTPQGEYCGVMGVAMDVTKDKNEMDRLRRAYEMSERASQAKSEFIANVSHDIRTPFAGISEMAKYMAKKETDATKKEELAAIIESSQRLLDFLTEVIDFAKLDSGTRPVNFTMFNIRDLIEDVVGMMRAQLRHKGVELRVNITEDSPEIFGDSLRIHRILLNLVGNAVKFTQKGYIEIRLEREVVTSERTHLYLIVEDTGIGIPPDKLNHIFEHFTQLSPTYGGRYSGTGLGLPIAKKFAEEIGGQLQVESELNKGSKFTLTIPVMTTKGTAPEIDDSKNTLSHTPSILLVEDDKLVQIFTRNIVTNLGYELDIASCAEEAKAALDKKDYDIILMDLGLPDQDGISLTEEIQHSLPPTTTVVAVTVNLTEQHEALCRAAGMKEMVTKPLTAEKFQALVKEFIHQPVSA